MIAERVHEACDLRLATAKSLSFAEEGTILNAQAQTAEACGSVPFGVSGSSNRSCTRPRAALVLGERQFMKEQSIKKVFQDSFAARVAAS